MPEVKSMNIALVGNMNNNFNALTRYLLSKGYNATLFLYDDNSPHFHPSKDVYDDSWKIYTRQLEWGSLKSFNNFSKLKVREDLEEFNKIICCGTGAAFLNKANIPIDIFIPYGSDLYEAPFFKLVKPVRFYTRFALAKYQRMAIKSSKNIVMASTGGMLEKYLNKIAPKGHVTNCGIPMVFYPQYFETAADNFAKESKLYKQILEQKKNNYKIVYHSSRHCWKSVSNEESRKNNHLLFFGLAKLLKENPETRIKIVTFEYGPDVAASKELINKLGIEDYVIWFPLTPRKELMLGLSLSELATGEFYHSYFSYGVVYESMALSIPLMHKREDALYINDYDSLYPMINASSVEEIYQTLIKLQSHPDEIGLVGKNSHQWFLEHMINQPIEEIISLLSK